MNLPVLMHLWAMSHICTFKSRSENNACSLVFFLKETHLGTQHTTAQEVVAKLFFMLLLHSQLGINHRLVSMEMNIGEG